MKRKVQVQAQLRRFDLFEPTIELPQVLVEPLRAQVLDLLRALLLEISAQEQIDQTTAGANNP